VQHGQLARANSAGHGLAGVAQDGTRPAHGARCRRAEREHDGLCGLAGGKPKAAKTEDGLHRKLH
jgi:hypothetical protein